MGDSLTTHLSVLDARVSLSAPAEILGPIAFAYRRFRVERPDGTERRVELDGAGIRIDDQVVPLVPGLDRTSQFYQRFLQTLMDGLGSHLLLHAAALADGRGRATLLAAPSGHGKTSLTLELLGRGMRFLGDDYAPLDPEARTVHPYPRAVGLVPDPAKPIPDRFRRIALAPDAVRLLGKSLVDVGQALGDPVLVTRPAALRSVILLTADESEATNATTWLEAAARVEVADRIEADLRAIDGVELVSRRSEPHLRAWKLRVSHDRFPTGKLAAILDRDAVIVSAKVWTTQPDFAGPPRAVPVKRREAAEWLGREMLNRRDGGRLLARYRGSIAAMFFDLARALSNVECYRVRVGGCRETADLVCELLND